MHPPPSLDAARNSYLWRALLTNRFGALLIKHEGKIGRSGIKWVALLMHRLLWPTPMMVFCFFLPLPIPGKSIACPH